MNFIRTRLSAAEKQLDRRMNLTARFPADALPPAQAYFSITSTTDMSLSDCIC